MKYTIFLIGFFMASPLLITASYFEDDEYDDDPELPDRKEMIYKLQEDDDVLVTKEPMLETSTTTEQPQKPSPSPYQKPSKWTQTQEVRGYRITTDGPAIYTDLVKAVPMLRIRVNIPDAARDIEQMLNRRNLELKIRTWDRIHKIHVNVPFGYEPEDLKVLEKKNHLSILAPIYGDVNEDELKRAITIKHLEYL